MDTLIMNFDDDDADKDYKNTVINTTKLYRENY